MNYKNLRIVKELRKYRRIVGRASRPVSLTKGQIDQLCEIGAIDFDSVGLMFFEGQQVVELAPDP